MLLAFVGVVFAMLGAITAWRPDFFNTLLLAGGALYALLGVTRTPKKPGKTVHRVTAEARGLSLDGETYMDRAAIERSYCEELPGPDGRYAVQLEGRFLRGGCAVFVDTKEDGAALVAALEADSTPGAAHFRALPPRAPKPSSTSRRSPPPAPPPPPKRGRNRLRLGKLADRTSNS